MKGAAHFHSLSAQENLVLKQAQDTNKLYSEVRRSNIMEVGMEVCNEVNNYLHVNCGNRDIRASKCIPHFAGGVLHGTRK